MVRTLECESCMPNSGVGSVPGRLSSVGSCARVTCENRGVSVLVGCLFCYFLNIGLGRIGSILSGVNVNYK